MHIKPIYAEMLSGSLDHLRGDPDFYEKYVRPHEEIYEFVSGHLKRVRYGWIDGPCVYLDR